MTTGRSGIVTVLVLASLMACERERRGFGDEPPPADSTDLPGLAASSDRDTVQGPYAANAWGASQGKRLFQAYNCTGCHAHGGGGMGPALMDAEWRYGAAPAEIYTSIASGRPGGMPAWGGRLPPQQIWQLVAYVRSMTGHLSKDVAPGRDDHMQRKVAEQSTRHIPPRVRPAPPP